MDVLQKAVQGLHLSPGGVRRPESGLQGRQLGAYQLPAAVHLLKLPLPLRGQLRSVALRVPRPGLLPDPGFPPKVPLENVVLQKIALAIADPGETGLEKTEHILILKASGHGLQGGEDQGYYGLIGKVAPPAQVHRHAVALKDVLHRPLVVLHPPYHYAEITEPAALPGHLGPNGGGNGLHFRVKVFPLIELNFRAFP